MAQKQTIGVGAAALVVGLVVGAAGMHLFSPTTASGAGATRGGFTGARTGTTGAFARNANNGNMLAGTIAKTASGSIVLNTRDGNSHVILITPNTTVSKSVAGSLTDVTKGSTVIISGTTNSDGSVSANLIQIRPASNTNNQPMIPAQ